MNVVVPLFLLAPLVLVPLGYRLIDVVVSGSGPSARLLRLLAPAAGLLVVAFWLPTGPAAGVLALPWLAVTASVAAAAAVRWLRDPARYRPSVRHATDAAVTFLAVGALFAVTDRLGVQPLGFSPTIILLTAVHFSFAGFVLPLSGALALTRRSSRRLELSIGAVVIGIPVTALGFVGLPLANWVGAVLTAVGGFGIGLATLGIARTLAGRSAAVLAAIAGTSLLVSMPLAVVYATGALTGAAWLGMDAMARIHGGLNAVGFALPVLVAWSLDRRSRVPITPARAGQPARDPRPLGLGAAAIIVGYAAILGLVVANAGIAEIGPPEGVARWSLFALLMLPGAIAVIGAWRRTSVLLTAAGVLCLAQSFIAFSGATLPFVIPGILLLALGASTRGSAYTLRARVGAVGAIALAIGSWFALLALTETVCWIARVGADGAYVYTRIPVSDTLTVGVGEVASGCAGGVTTIQGVALATILAVGAIAVAELSSRRTVPARPPGGPAGPLDVVRFNALPFVLGPSIAVVAGVLALTSIPDPLRHLLAAIAVAAATISLSAMIAVVWVFRVGAGHRWAWIDATTARSARWANITTGFDDSTSTLRRLMPRSQGEAVDVFDETVDHESALLVARRRFPAATPPVRAGELARCLGTDGYDTAFLLMSAHEAHGQDRGALFIGIARALAPGGRLVLVEHLRDWPNRLAFGPGANHFQTRQTWLTAATDAGLMPIDEARLTPYVRGFVFERPVATR